MVIPFTPSAVRAGESGARDTIHVAIGLLPQSGTSKTAETACELHTDCDVYSDKNIKITVKIDGRSGFKNDLSVSCMPKNCYFDNQRNEIQFNEDGGSFRIYEGMSPAGLELRTAKLFCEVFIKYYGNGLTFSRQYGAGAETRRLHP